MHFALKFVFGFVATAWFFYTPIDDGIEDKSSTYPLVPFMKIERTISESLFRAGFMNGQHYPFRLMIQLNAWLSRKTFQFPDIDIQERYLGEVRALLYIPKNLTTIPQEKRAAVIFYHGGGYIVGNPEMYHPLIGQIASDTNTMVVAIDYRLAPEHPHPAGLDDSLAATRYFLKHSQKEWGISEKSMFLVGDSAGGHIAAAMALRLQELGLTKPRGVILIYAVLQSLSSNTPSFQENENDFMLPRKKMIQFTAEFYEKSNEPRGVLHAELLGNNQASPEIRENYAKRFNLSELVVRGSPGNDQNGKTEVIAKWKHIYEDPINSPLFADLQGFPRTLLISSKYDVLRDDSVMMERRLKANKVPVIHEMFASYHGMVSLAEHYKPARRALDMIKQFISNTE